MKLLECVRATTVSPGMDEYLKKLIKEVGYEHKLLSWENADISKNTPVIALASFDILAELKSMLINRENKIVIALNSRKDFKLVSELKDHMDKIFGFIDISQEIDYNLPLLKNYINSNFTTQTVNLNNLADDIEKIYEFTQSQLTRIKDLHDRLVKVRTDKLKGIVVTSKFMAGEKSGGEFFEIMNTDQELLFIQAGSNSYILSSMILSEIEQLKDNVKSSDLSMEIDKFLKIITHHANENKAELTYCLMRLNLKTLIADFHCQGEGHVYYQNELITFNEPLKLKLTPKDRLAIVSTGALRNLATLNSRFNHKSFYQKNQDKSVKDLINEFFFEVSRHKAGNFLIYDALMAVVEIEENTLYQLS